MHTSSDAPSSVFDVTQLDNRPGLIIFKAEGKGAFNTFEHEPGGHRIQHVPKHDKKGRTHTSTVTVCVLKPAKRGSYELDPRDLEIKTCRGSGNGGQHRNTTDSAVQVTHKPSGLQVRCESERSQHQNKENAMMLLQARLQEQDNEKRAADRSAERKNQIGVGARGDRRRSYYFQRDEVVDHETGKSWKLKQWLSGSW